MGLNVKRYIFSALFLLVFITDSASAGEPERELWAAAKQGNADAVKQLLADGADINAATKYGVTALSYACDRGHSVVARLLVEAGAEVNTKDTFYGFTPLARAASGSHVRGDAPPSIFCSSAHAPRRLGILPGRLAGNQNSYQFEL